MKLNTNFVTWFRSAAPYINTFRGKTFVIAFSGKMVTDDNFITLVHDINLLTSLGVQLVLVHGARPQINARLTENKLHTPHINGIRVTNSAALQCVKESIGRIHAEIEALLSMGLPSSPMANASIHVSSGNFVTACPIGVINGCDFMYTGKVRKINAKAIHSFLTLGNVVLISPLGYSPTGEIFNLTMENVATEVAIALKAEKLIFHIDQSTNHADLLPRELTVTESKQLISHPPYNTTIKNSGEIIKLLNYATTASDGGVARIHLITRHIDGAILQELFTHNGIGCMISQTPLQTLRQAKVEDIGGILKLIEPLEAQGILVRRNRELLEIEIEQFTILEHDSMIIGCAALYPFPNDQSCELACLAIHSDYSNSGNGGTLLAHIENKALTQGHKQLFVLTTHTTHWFIEHGFIEIPPSELPKAKQDLYNYQRLSKVFIKTLN